MLIISLVFTYLTQHTQQSRLGSSIIFVFYISNLENAPNFSCFYKYNLVHLTIQKGILPLYIFMYNIYVEPNNLECAHYFSCFYISNIAYLTIQKGVFYYICVLHIQHNTPNNLEWGSYKLKQPRSCSKFFLFFTYTTQST